ncbi:hypothetical protein IWQ62_002569 [Dispira parvispora]|uniref:STAS domain-containing protein n=1 Tax=Dispira parvispora TaxID=1520584 RepID=A0A9W8AVF5_9FUNG|nr:hypothetical protein IWQ62_002569 [Dispira parvispora]
MATPVDEQSPLLQKGRRPLLERRGSTHRVCFDIPPTNDLSEASTQSSIGRYPLTPGIQSGISAMDAEGPLGSVGLTQPSTWDQFATRMRYYVPVVGWLPDYDGGQLWNDVRAGLTVACLLIPQALSYGSLARLSPINGLYTALVPMFVYGIFGTSRHLAMGPEALISTIVGTVIADYEQTVDKTTSPALLDAAGVARVVTFLVGIFSFLLGIFRLGFLDSILSKALLRGFVTAVAFVIIIGQLIPLCGFYHLGEKLPSVHASPIEKLRFVIEHFGEAHQLTLWVSMGCIEFLVGAMLVKRRFKRIGWIQQFPEILVTVVMSTLLCYLFEWHTKGLLIFGRVDSGFPTPHLPRLPEAVFYKDAFTSALLISIIGIVESIIIAREYASKNHYSVSPNRELVALGLANLLGCVFGAYPAFGSLARSRLNDRAKAKTQFAGVITGALVLLTITLLLPLFHYLPKAVLSAIIFNTGLSLLTKTPRELRFLYRVGAWRDIILLTLIFVSTMVVSVEVGIMLAVILSLMTVIKKTTVPRITILGRITGTKDQFAPVPDFPDQVEHVQGVMVVRIEEPLFFANTGQLQARLKRLELFGDMDTHPSERARLPPAQAVIFDVENMPDVDASALAILKEIVESYHLRKIIVCFVRLHPSLYLTFEKSGLREKVGHQLFFVTVADALEHVEQARSYSCDSASDSPQDTDNEFATF